MTQEEIQAAIEEIREIPDAIDAMEKIGYDPEALTTASVDAMGRHNWHPRFVVGMICGIYVEQQRRKHDNS